MKWLLPLALVACSSSSSTDGPVGSSPDAPRPAIDAPPGTPDAPPGMPDAPPVAGTPDAPPTTMYTLMINNYSGWCTVTENGASYSPSKSFPAGTVVNLTAAPESGTFVWGYWSGTDAGSHDTNMTTTVTMNADQNVLACCPVKPPASQTCP